MPRERESDIREFSLRQSHYLVRKTAETLKSKGMKDRIPLRPLEEFVRALDKTAGPSAIGMTYKDDFVHPFLEVYVLWSQPFDLTSDVQNDRMMEVAELHGILSQGLAPGIDTHLEFADPGIYQTAKDFERALVSWAAESRESFVLAFGPLGAAPKRDAVALRRP